MRRLLSDYRLHRQETSQLAARRTGSTQAPTTLRAGEKELLSMALKHRTALNQSAPYTHNSTTLYCIQSDSVGWLAGWWVAIFSSSKSFRNQYKSTKIEVDRFKGDETP
ncbi:hypothetical protein AMTR_s00066p00163080 [Amborella trichopoda]|uniref:Uncharacterized protein n=1 Tax=Amborella trichopoda TaxID=13333 RepID=U5DDF9_AMBTC|nr:hypothetical protein AMTR_s00066p00163080 [Amborella trichopoda]